MPLSNEELYDGLVNGVLPDLGLEVLCDRFKPLIMAMSWGFRRMLGIDKDEMLQEAKLLLVKLVQKKSFRLNGKAHFVSFFYPAFRFRLLQIYQDYMLHNPMWIGERRQRVGKTYNCEQLLAYNQRYIERYYEKKRVWDMRRIKQKRGIELPDRIEYTPDEEDDGSSADERIQDLIATTGAGSIIAIPLEGHSAKSIRILLGMIYNKQDIFNKACGGHFYVSLGLLDRLMYTTAKWQLEEALQIVRHAGKDMLSGIIFGRDTLYFDGFPTFMDMEHYQAWRAFSIAISEASKMNKFIVIKKQYEENEKYSLYYWMQRLHLGGPNFANIRRILRENLSGSSGFRTSEVMRRITTKFKSKPGFAEWKREQVRKYYWAHREEILAREQKRNQEKKLELDTSSSFISVQT